MKQKFVLLLLVVSMSLQLTACGKQEPEPPAPETPVVTEPEVQPEPVPEPAPEPEPVPEEISALEALRQSLRQEDAMGAIIFLGYYEDAPMSKAFLDTLEQEGYLAEYPFIEEITATQIARTEGGEIYCIIPAEPDMDIAVTQLNLDPETMEEEPGRSLYQSNSGDPFLICGNISDLYSNLLVTMMDGAERVISAYRPHISLRDGFVVLPEDGKLKDLTHYSQEQLELKEHGVSIYVPNENADGLELAEGYLETQDPSALLRLLIEQGVIPEDVTVNRFAVTTGGLELDLSESLQTYLGTMGTTGEKMILGSLVNTFLSCYDTTSMIITVEGAPLTTGHNVYEEPFGFIES